jgi:tRNA(Ile2) C34 agmatinyltransferase TiaS
MTIPSHCPTCGAEVDGAIGYRCESCRALNLAAMQALLDTVLELDDLARGKVKPPRRPVRDLPGFHDWY